MKFVFAVLFLLAFPVLVLVFRHEFLGHVQETMARQVNEALGAPEFHAVRPEMNYVDVTLTGYVAEPALRERARERVDAIPGLRCREQDNRLEILAEVSAKLAGNRLTLTGWLHHESAVREVVRWVEDFRPGLVIETEGIHLSQHVTVNPVPEPGTSPPLLAQVQGALQVASSVSVVRDGRRVRVSGYVPEAGAREAVMQAVPLKEGPVDIDFSELHSGTYVLAALFSERDALADLVTEFLAVPAAVPVPGGGCRSIEAHGDQLMLRGVTTPTGKARWMGVVEHFPRALNVVADFELHPSVYHLPTYQPESALAPDVLETLRRTLRDCAIPDQKLLPDAAALQSSTLDTAAAAILAAGPGALVVVGSPALPEENRNAARRRADLVAQELTARGVPENRVEVAVFDPVPALAASGRRVEILVR